MAKIVKDVQAVLDKKEKLGKEFRDQINSYEQFKSRMKDAGVEYGEKFSIPLMSRLGHFVNSD